MRNIRQPIVVIDVKKMVYTRMWGQNTTAYQSDRLLSPFDVETLRTRPQFMVPDEAA